MTLAPSVGPCGTRDFGTTPFGVNNFGASLFGLSLMGVSLAGVPFAGSIFLGGFDDVAAGVFGITGGAAGGAMGTSKSRLSDRTGRSSKAGGAVDFDD
jgi:hypothetical protein